LFSEGAVYEFSYGGELSMGDDFRREDQIFLTSSCITLNGGKVVVAGQLIDCVNRAGNELSCSSSRLALQRYNSERHEFDKSIVINANAGYLHSGGFSMVSYGEGFVVVTRSKNGREQYGGNSLEVYNDNLDSSGFRSCDLNFDQQIYSLARKGKTLFGVTKTGFSVIDMDSCSGTGVAVGLFPPISYIDAYGRRLSPEYYNNLKIATSEMEDSVFLFVPFMGILEFSSDGRDLRSFYGDPSFRYYSSAFIGRDGDIVYAAASNQNPSRMVLGSLAQADLRRQTPPNQMPQFKIISYRAGLSERKRRDNPLFIPMGSPRPCPLAADAYSGAKIDLQRVYPLDRQKSFLSERGWGARFSLPFPFGASNSILVDNAMIMTFYDSENRQSLLGRYNLKARKIDWSTLVLQYGPGEKGATSICMLGDDRVAAFDSNTVSEFSLRGELLRKTRADFALSMQVNGCATTSNGDVLVIAEIHAIDTARHASEACVDQYMLRVDEPLKPVDYVAILRFSSSQGEYTKANGLEYFDRHGMSVKAISPRDSSNDRFFISVGSYFRYPMLVEVDGNIGYRGHVPVAGRATGVHDGSIISATNRGLFVLRGETRMFYNFAVNDIYPFDPERGYKQFTIPSTLLTTEAATYLFMPHKGIIRFSEDASQVKSIVRDYRFSGFNSAHQINGNIVFSGTRAACLKGALVSVPERDFDSYCAELTQVRDVGFDVLEERSSYGYPACSDFPKFFIVQNQTSSEVPVLGDSTIQTDDSFSACAV
jgi:hypothetical protein